MSTVHGSSAAAERKISILKKRFGRLPKKKKKPEPVDWALMLEK